MNKYSNLGNRAPANGYYGNEMDYDFLNNGMDMDYEEYYDEDLQQSGDTEYQIQQHYNQQQLAAYAQQKQMAQMMGGAVGDSSQGFTDSMGLSGNMVAGLEGYEFMEEELDDDYNPTNEEIEEYARFLGMDISED